MCSAGEEIRAFGETRRKEKRKLLVRHVPPFINMAHMTSTDLNYNLQFWFRTFFMLKRQHRRQEAVNQAHKQKKIIRSKEHALVSFHHKLWPAHPTDINASASAFLFIKYQMKRRTNKPPLNGETGLGQFGACYSTWVSLKAPRISLRLLKK